MAHMENGKSSFLKSYTNKEFDSIPAKGYCAPLLLFKLYLRSINCEWKFNDQLTKKDSRTALADFIEKIIIIKIKEYSKEYPKIPEYVLLTLQGYANTLREDDLEDIDYYQERSSAESGSEELWLSPDHFPMVCAIIGVGASLWQGDDGVCLFPGNWLQLSSSTVHVTSRNGVLIELPPEQAKQILLLPNRVGHAGNHLFLLNISNMVINKMIDSFQ